MSVLHPSTNRERDRSAASASDLTHRDRRVAKVTAASHGEHEVLAL